MMICSDPRRDLYRVQQTVLSFEIRPVPWNKAVSRPTSMQVSPPDMIVLQVIPQLDAGGAERTTLEVAEAIVAEGGRALVASEGGRMESELSALGGELVRLPVASKNPLTLWQNTRKLIQIIRSEQVQIVHARSRAPAWSAKWAADRTDAHFVTTYHGTYTARSALKRRYNAVMAKGERVIANSEFIHAHVLREHPFADGRITVIPRGVDLEQFVPERVERSRVDALAKAWGVEPAGDTIALFPARLTAWKGQREVIAALGHMAKAGKPVPLTLLAGDAQGRDDYVAELEAQIETFGLRERVRLVGHCTDMPAALAMSDLVLTPSVKPEAFGRTAAEAGAMEKPVIAADHGGAREVVEQGVTGWRVEPGSVDALETALAAAISQPEVARAAMGKAARQRIESRFSAKALQTATLRVYREVLD